MNNSIINDKGYYRLPDDIDNYISGYSDRTESFLKNELSAEEFKSIRVINGIYEQRENNTYMVRIRISAGMLTLSQGKCIAELARTYGNGQIHVTNQTGYPASWHQYQRHTVNHAQFTESESCSHWRRGEFSSEYYLSSTRRTLCH